MGLNFWKVLPLPFNKEGGGGKEEGGSNCEAADKKVELQQDEQLQGSEFHIVGQGYYKWCCLVFKT